MQTNLEKGWNRERAEIGRPKSETSPNGETRPGAGRHRNFWHPDFAFLSAFGFRLSGLLLAVITILVPTTHAFPPAPPHIIFGIVRDQIGNPLADGAEVILEAASGVKVRGFVLAREAPGANYQIEVSMDAGLTSDLYSPTALVPTVPFKIRVMVGRTTYLPMEMAADYAKLGLPSGRTRIDLTLGVDEDGNGIPDAWEKAVAAFLGRPWAVGQIRPQDLYPGSGMTYRDVYLAGTYAVEPKDGLALQILSPAGEAPRLAFTAVKGRSYTVQAASTLGDWSDVSFRVLPAAADAPEQRTYQAAQTQRLEIEAPIAPGTAVRFFRLIVH